jgi:hypothetical protein
LRENFSSGIALEDAQHLREVLRVGVMQQFRESKAGGSHENSHCFAPATGHPNPVLAIGRILIAKGYEGRRPVGKPRLVLEDTMTSFLEVS